MTFYTISALINAITSLIIALLVILHDLKSKKHITFALFSFSVFMWSAAYFFWQIAIDKNDALFWSKILMFFASLIPFLYFHFIVELISGGKREKIFVVIGYIFAVIFASLSFTKLMIIGVSEKLSFSFWPDPGPLYSIFLLIWIIYVLYGSFLLLRSLRNSTTELRTQYLYILIGMGIGYVGGITNFFLWFNIPISPFGNIFVSFYVIMVAYAIFKNNLFSIKIIATEFFIGVLNTFLLIRFFISPDTTTKITDLILLLLSSIFGILLIRSVKEEIDGREKIRLLAKRLSETNFTLAKTNEQLRVFDQRKSEFISIVSHQLRTPITAIKGYASLILEGSYGKFPDVMKVPLERIFLSSDRLAKMVTEFLDISKIEQGTMTYNLVNVDIGAMLDDLSDDFEQAVEEKNLTLSVYISNEEKYIAQADEGKIRQILSNMIDNAIKYSIRGEINIFLEKNELRNTIIIKIVDTGIGLSQDDIHHLFGKFTRGSGGQGQNTDGSGLGLYVAKKMLESQNGKIWVDSEGPGKGSKFIVELPAANNK